MAIKYRKKFKDKKNRNFFLKNEKKKNYYKFLTLKYGKLLNSNNLILRKKAALMFRSVRLELQKMPNIKINNYCLLTGRDKGVYRAFKLSRHQIKENFKFLNGLRNSSF